MKSVLITGATRNTGYGIARKFASEGWAVFITSRKAEDAQAAAESVSKEFGTPCFGIGYNPIDYHSVDTVLAEVHQAGYVLDSVILNSAAQGLACDPLTVPIDEWADVITTNVIGAFSLARTVAKDMVDNQKGGTLVFLGSINYITCLDHRSSYNTSKGGIFSMTKSLAVDLGQYGIRSNLLIAGPIATDRYDKLDEATRKMRNDICPIKRVSTAEDIARGVWFLATDESGNTTGTTLTIDGGMSSQNAGRF